MSRRTGPSDLTAPDTDQELWRLTVEHSPVGMCLVSLAGEMLLPNRAFHDMIGYTREEIRRLTFQEITYPEDLAEDLALVAQLMSGERSSYRLVKRYLHADGSIVWGDLSVALMRADDGTPLHFISQVVDVTSQRRARERLAEAMRQVEQERSLSQAMIDAVDVGLVLTDREGRVQRMNRRQRDLQSLVYPDGPVGRRPAARPADPDVSPGFCFGPDGVTPLPTEQMPTERAARGEEFDDERVWVGRDAATRRALSVSARSVPDEHGERVGSALAFSDVTDLVQALQAREVFERSVSHELRTPLTSVLGHLELLLDSDELTEATTRRVEVVHRNAVRLQHLVSDLLDPAARGRGTLALARAVVDVAALARESVETVRPAAADVGLTIAADADLVVEAYVDADRVRQVLENLLSNAVKYTDPGGRVDLRVDVEPDTVAVSISDTGIGIAAEDLDRLYDPFFRAEPARERIAPGVGLGLGIARSIVTAHGGRLDVTSEVGVGSCFTVRLPLRTT